MRLKADNTSDAMRPYEQIYRRVPVSAELRTELPAETPSECSSVFCSTAVSAAKIFSTGISSFTLTLNSSSPSRSRFLWRSSWTAASGETRGKGQ